MGYQGVVVVALISILAYLTWDKYFTGNTEKVRSTIDGHEYVVKSLPDKQEAANLLASISANLDSLVTHLQKMYPDDERTKRLVKGFDSRKISEGGDDSNQYTSYSVNKGERIVFCLRSRDASDGQNGTKLVDINMMIFVAVHELAHIATESVGHTDDFWANMRYLLEESINIGIYTKQDFKNKPVDYCGVKVTSTPLDK